jgi:hypothetical protein
MAYAVIDSRNCRCCSQGRPEEWKGQFALGPQLKGGGANKKLQKDINIDNCRQNSGFDHSWDLRFQTFPEPPNHSIRRWNHEEAKVKFCPRHPNFPGCCSVYVDFGILNINCSLFCGYTLL